MSENYPSIAAQTRSLPELMLRKVGRRRRRARDQPEEESAVAPMAASIDGEWVAVACSGIGRPNVIALFEGRKAFTKKPVRWLELKSPSPIIDLCFTRAHSSEGSAFHRARLVSATEKAVSVWDVQTGFLLFEATRCPLASPSVAAVTNSCTVVLWQRGGRGVSEWNVGGDGVFSTTPCSLERPCSREVVLCAAGGGSADCSLGLCLATDRHLVAWRAGCPLLLDNSTTAELIGQCEQLVIYHDGVAALLGFGKACLWSGSADESVVPVELDRGPVERLFAHGRTVYGFTETGSVMTVEAAGCGIIDRRLPENTGGVLPVHDEGYVVELSSHSVLYYDTLGGGFGVEIELGIPSSCGDCGSVGCWVLGKAGQTVWKILVISADKAIARRMNTRDGSDVVLSGIDHQTITFMTGLSDRPGLVAGGSAEGAVMLWDLSSGFFTGEPVFFVPSSPSGEVVDIRRCSVMAAFSREGISPAEPLVIATVEDTGAARVLVADLDPHGGLDGLREIL
ncbi:hypothetical protein FOZ61_009208, partial [Perkinsus olseni]